jgi:hypothetical protein
MAAKAQHRSRYLELLTLLALLVGVISTLSYAIGAAAMLRSGNSSLGAWWDARQFYFMEGAATALGLLIGIRAGCCFIADAETCTRAVLIAFVLAIIAFMPMINVCSAAARLGWSAQGAGTESWIIGREGFEAGKQLDKILIAGVYFLKTVGFALLAGLALIAVGAVASLMTGAGADAEPVATDSRDT